MSASELKEFFKKEIQEQRQQKAKQKAMEFLWNPCTVSCSSQRTVRLSWEREFRDACSVRRSILWNHSGHHLNEVLSLPSFIDEKKEVQSSQSIGCLIEGPSSKDCALSSEGHWTGHLIISIVISKPPPLILCHQLFDAPHPRQSSECPFPWSLQQCR